MSKKQTSNIGNVFSDRFYEAEVILNTLPPLNGRDIPVLEGVLNGKYTKHIDQVCTDFRDIILATECVYCYDSQIVLDDGQKLETLIENKIVSPATPAIITNIVLTTDAPDHVPQPPTALFLQTTFNSHLVTSALPVIEQYATHPIYDDNFQLHQPGYDPSTGIFVHGGMILPTPFTPNNTAVGQDVDTVRDSLPPALREMLVDFPFATTIDLVNFVGVMIMCILAPLFTSTGRPIILLSGNQKGVGKTLLGHLLGVLLDNKIPYITEFCTNNEELSKRILSSIRSHQQSVVFIDNARTNSGGGIDSTTLESMAVAESISMRVLGTSNNDKHRNDYPWFISMNSAKTTPDLASRSVIVNLAFEGDTSSRHYHHTDLLAYAKKHRNEILGTLFGMIEHWKSRGSTLGTANHRFVRFAQVISGILDSCGFFGFLSNQQEVCQQVNMVNDELSALFDAAIQGKGPFTPDATFFPDDAIAARDWIPIVKTSGIMDDRFSQNKNDRSQATQIGITFARLLEIPFSFDTNGMAGTARLTKEITSRKHVGYRFSISVDAIDGNESTPQESAPPL